METYPDLAQSDFRRLKKLCDDAIGQITKPQFFPRPSETDNSIAHFYKHLIGNMRSHWTDFLTTDGEKPDRNRHQEFEINEDDTYDHLLENWNKV